MINPDLQIINDEIICYKKALEEVEEKLNLLTFLDEIDSYMAVKINLDRDDLISRRKELENKLKALFQKKIKLTGNDIPHHNLDTGKNYNAFLISNYLSLQNLKNEVENSNFESNSQVP